MRYFIKNLFYIYICILITCFVSEVTTAAIATATNPDETEKVIKILIEKPHPLEIQYKDDVLSTINNHFMQQNFDNDILRNVRLEFSYCDKGNEDESQKVSKNEVTSKYMNDSEYVNYLKCVIKHSQDSEYDMLLLDDKFLFSDLSFVENIRIEEIFGFRKLYKNYVDLSSYSLNHDLSFHNRKIMIDGKYNKEIIYGLPYDFDFDVLFYHDDTSHIGNLPLESWDDLLKMGSSINTLPENLNSPSPTNLSTDKNNETPSTKNTNNTISSNTPSVERNITSPGNQSSKQNNTTSSSSSNTQSSKANSISSNTPTEKNNSIADTVSNDKQAKDKRDNLSQTSSLSENFNAPLSIPLNDRNQLLSLLVEYISEKRNLTFAEKTTNRKYYEYFYDTQSYDLYRDFRSFVENCSGLSIPEILNVKYKEALQSFVSGEKKFFKGKMSHYPYLKKFSNITFSTTLPPKRFSVVNEHFLVINKHSKKNMDMLVEAIFQLTSKEMQYFRTSLDYLPTYNMSLGATDEVVGAYCQDHMDLCQMIDEMDEIHVQKTFKKDKFSVTFMEIRLLLPLAMKKFLENNNINSIIKSFTNIMEVKIFRFKYPDSYTIALYILLFIYVVFLSFVIYLVYRNRKHPYLKVISPDFCILVMIGLITNSFTPVLLTHITSTFVCRFIYVQGVVSRNLIFIPLLTVVLRIYCIYNNKSRVTFGKQLNNKRLLRYIGFFLLFFFIGSMIIAIVKEFYIITLGDINNIRYLKCYHHGTKFHVIAGAIYYTIIVSIKKNKK